MSTTIPKARTAEPGPVSKFIAGFILVPIILVLCWNYGFTEVLQALGAGDANVSVFEGALAIYFTTGFTGILRSGLL